MIPRPRVRVDGPDAVGARRPRLAADRPAAPPGTGLPGRPAHHRDRVFRGRLSLRPRRQVAPRPRPVPGTRVHRLGPGAPTRRRAVRQPAGLDRRPGSEPERLPDHHDQRSRDVSAVQHAARARPVLPAGHHTAPHTPWGEDQHPREYLEPYDDCDFPSLPRQPLHPWFDRGDGELGRAASDPPSGLRGYAASLTAQVSADRDAFARPVSGAGQNSPVWTADPDTARYASQAQPIVTAG